MGAWGPVVAAIAWIPVCLLFVPGMILSLSTGFAFDFLPAFSCTLIGATVGSTCAALAGRYLAREAVEEQGERAVAFASVAIVMLYATEIDEARFERSRCGSN